MRSDSPMSSTRPANRIVLHPDVLANALDLWALRREKILALLDIRAARRARKLACTCRVLAQPTYAQTVGEDAWRGEWRRTREEVLETLAHAAPGVAQAFSDPEMDRDTCPGFFGDSLHDTQHDSPTRAVDWSEVELTETDRPTRVVEMSWPAESKVA
jgi:hypothetical protein